MGKRDFIHGAVVRALEKKGWRVTDDPLLIDIDEGERSFEIDIGAQRVMITANKGTQHIAIEVKTFGAPSLLSAFHTVLGQYLNYRDALEDNGIERPLFIAVPTEIWSQLQEIQFLYRQIRRYDIKIIVVDVTNENIESWIAI